MPFHDDCDAAGRWVFEIEHPCGHRELHQIQVQQPDGSLGFPSQAERDYLRGRLAARPCHGCLSGHLKGRAVGLLPRGERSPSR